MAFRADAASIGPAATGELSFYGKVVITEISGSESFIHVDVGVGTWVCLVSGVHEWAPGRTAVVNIDPRQVFVFDASGRRVQANVLEGAEP